MIKRFRKGIFNKRPSLPWKVVLNYLETLDNNSCSVTVDIRNMDIKSDFIKIRFGDLLKQSKLYNHLRE